MPVCGKDSLATSRPAGYPGLGSVTEAAHWGMTPGRAALA
jgi:hypothetical protein